MIEKMEMLTYSLNNLVKLIVVYQRKDGTLERCNQWWECEVSSGSLLWSDLEAVLKDAIYNTTNTE